MMNRINFFLRTSVIGQSLTKLGRNLRSTNKKSKTTKNNKSDYDFDRIIHVAKRIPKYVLILSFIIFIIVVIAIYWKFYLDIKPVSFDRDSTHLKAPTILNLKSINVAVYGVEKKDNYNYVVYSGVYSLDSELRIVHVSPLFQNPSDSDQVINTVLNINMSKIENGRMAYLNNIMENLTGLRVDRYVIFDKDEFLDFIQDVDYEFSEDSEIKSLSDAFVTNKIKENDYVDTQAGIVESFIDQNLRFKDKINYFFNSKNILSIFKTDMNRSEFIHFVNYVSSKDQIQSLELDFEHGTIQNSNTKFIQPNFIVIDEEIDKVFNNIPVLAEQAEIEIYNSTDITGYASKKTREFQNIGINVVKYGNYFEKADENILFLNEESDLSKYRNTIDIIRRTLRDKLDIRIDEYKYNSTGDLILVLGGE